MRICASRACGQDHGCSSETAPRATRSSALSGHTCVMGREAAVPQIGGLVPPRETGGRALLPRGSRPARPARIPPAPVPGSRPPVGSSRLSLWDETTPLPIHYATSRKSSKEFRIPSVDAAGGTLARTRASAWSSRRGWLPWEIRERMEKSRDERRSHASLPVEAHPRPATDG